MLSVQPMILAAALTATGGNVEMLEFTATWCGPCQTMKGTVEQIKSMGYTVHSIDFDRHKNVVQRFQVKQVPTYVVVSNGRELERVVGAVPGNQLVEMLRRHESNARANVVPATHTQQVATNTQPPQSRSGIPRARSPQSNAPQPNSSQARLPQASQRRTPNFETTAMHASVRLRIDDSRGHSFGTGTIVDVHGQDALILTCGHIFRDSKGKGRITVELFAPDAEKLLVGELIRYDLDRDVALVGIKTRSRLTPIRIAGPSYTVRSGQPVFSIGCNHGEDPTVMRGRINAVNKYLGSDNLTASGRPVDGRSGGGLFSADGFLVGVCNAADPQSDEGLYAAYRSIHEQLDQSGLSFVYQPRPRIDQVATRDRGVPVRQVGQSAASDRSTPSTRSTPPPFPPNTTPNTGMQMGRDGNLPSGETIAGLRDAEVICIIRARNAPQQEDRLIVLDRPSRDFMTRLQREDSIHQQRRFTEMRVNSRRLANRPSEGQTPAKVTK